MVSGPFFNIFSEGGVGEEAGWTLCAAAPCLRVIRHLCSRRLHLKQRRQGLMSVLSKPKLRERGSERGAGLSNPTCCVQLKIVAVIRDPDCVVVVAAG